MIASINRLWNRSQNVKLSLLLQRIVPDNNKLQSCVPASCFDFSSITIGQTIFRKIDISVDLFGGKQQQLIEYVHTLVITDTS